MSVIAIGFFVLCIVVNAIILIRRGGISDYNRRNIWVPPYRTRQEYSEDSEGL